MQLDGLCITVALNGVFKILRSKTIVSEISEEILEFPPCYILPLNKFALFIVLGDFSSDPRNILEIELF